MSNLYPYTTSEDEREARREARILARKLRRRAKIRKQILRSLPILGLTLVAAGMLWAGIHQRIRNAQAADTPAPAEMAAPLPVAPETEPEPEFAPLAVADAKTVELTDEIISEYAVLMDLDEGYILAQKSPDAVIYPASMTKILTVLTAAEHITDFTGTATIDIAITDYCFSNDCSVVGFLLDEVVPVEDLFYGTILSSGADAALALANYTAGSHEAFVELMNEKVEELGLSETAHFTNCVGIFDEENVCTVSDMAVILQAAMENELCRRVLTTKVYYAQPTALFPEERVLSNWFLRRIEDKDTGDIEVLGAKTGYVFESGNCAASYAQRSDGSSLICVTGKSTSSWNAIYDHVALYSEFAQ